MKLSAINSTIAELKEKTTKKKAKPKSRWEASAGRERKELARALANHPGTQKDIAQKAGISEPELTKIKKGYRDPSHDAEVALGDALGTSAANLFPELRGRKRG